MKLFIVNKVADWQPVSEYLLMTAFGSPLSEQANYSASETEVFQRTEFSAMAIYQTDMIISLVLTVEPSAQATLTNTVPPTVHLFIVQLVPTVGNPRLEKLNDRLAQEIAHNILHVHEERQDDALTAVRHFFRSVS